MQIKRRKKRQKNKRGANRFTSNREIIKKRRLKAIEMRLAGKGFREIAEACGVSLGQAFTDIKNAFKDVDKELVEKADHLRMLELTRLDKLLEQLQEGHKLKERKIVIGKGTKKKAITIKDREIDTVNFVYAMLRLMDRRAAYIPGLNAPKEIKADVGEKLREQMDAANLSLMETLKQLAGEK